MRERLCVLIATVALSWACSGKPTTAPTATPATQSPTVTAVTVTGNAPLVGQTTQLTATATLSNGTTQDVTAQATWQSSNASIVSVASGGLATGAAAGEADVRAVYSGATGSLHLKLQPRTFAVSGVIVDSDSGRAIDGEVEVVEGANAGMVTRADSGGHYALSGLAPGSFALRARATGYDSTDTRVTVVDADAHADIALRRTPSRPDYSGSWTGQYKIIDCTSIDPPGVAAIDLCRYPAALNTYKFTVSQNGGSVTGTYRMVTAMFSCPCGGEYGTFDISGTVAADGSLTMTTSGAPRASGVMLNAVFTLRLSSASTLGGSVTGTLGLGTTVRATFAGSVLSGAR